VPERSTTSVERLARSMQCFSDPMPTPTLRLVPRYTPGPMLTETTASKKKARFLPWLGLAAAMVGAVVLASLWWWSATAETREIQALPDEQRLPLFHRTVENLKNVCDPAAPVSLRDFCRQQAALALKFRECAPDRDCMELARRHISQPHR
jgi:hypothetical protein